MTEEIKYFILGLIQGLAEFFPISSSGHIILFSSILDLVDKHPLLLSITVHFGTTLSTIIIYWKRIKHMLIGVITYRDKNAISFFLKLLVSSIPLVILGFAFRERINFIFQNSGYLVCIMLLFTGFILLISTTLKGSNKNITFIHALIIGLAQAIAILPGISRSGLTIVTALFCNIKREHAAEFSFLMVLFPIIGITIIQLLSLLSSDLSLEFVDIKGLLISFFTSFVSGLFACKYMIKVVQKNNLKYFGYYCLFMGMLFGFFFNF